MCTINVFLEDIPVYYHNCVKVVDLAEVEEIGHFIPFFQYIKTRLHNNMDSYYISLFLPPSLPPSSFFFFIRWNRSYI
jgi:hypothetical protein